ncbi:MAG: serine/threonine-protein kinase [Planctomycetota bacterium]
MAADPRQAKELFQELLELEPQHRASRLSEREATDPELVRRVRSLFASLDELDTMFDRSAISLARPPIEELGPGSTIGPFEIVDRIGEGGFAIVYRAKQSAPVVRDVALKVLKPGIDSSQVVARFEAERQALAMMEHPSIATVFDGGVTDAGRFWFAMELVNGQELTAWSAERVVPIAERLRMFVRLCHAVQHAHQKGVIHRDLKPSNILVTQVNGIALPVVIDFGVAKALEEPSQESPLATRLGQMIGTPAYMAPEQFEGSLDIDTRSDVYALGTILYELLSGSRPFEDSTLKGMGLAEAIRIVQEVVPPRPSLRLQQRDGRSASRSLSNDLDWIVMQCLEKDRDRRYESVSVLANEIERALRHEPVLAGPPDWSYRASKFLRRHRLPIAAGSMIVALLAVGLFVVSQQLTRARNAERELTAENEQKEKALAREIESSRFWESLWSRIDPDRTNATDSAFLQGLLQEAQTDVDRQAFGQSEVEAAIRRILGNAWFAIGRPDTAEEQMRLALELRERLLDPDDPDRLLSAHEYGALLASVGKADLALPILRDVADRRTRVLGEDDPATLRSVEALGNTLRATGQDDEALTVLEGLTESIERNQDGPDARSIRAINNLALLYSDLGAQDAALEMLELAAIQQEQVHGETHPDTHRAWNNLGQELCAAGRSDEGLPYLRKALDGKRAQLTDGHPSALIGFNNLASYLRELGVLDESEALFLEGLQSAEDAGTDRTEAAAVLRFNYANLLHALEREEEAERTFARAASDAQANLGERSTTTIRLRAEHGWQLFRMERYEEAEVQLVGSHEFVDRLPDKDAAHAVYPIRYGLLLEATGQTNDARPLLERGLAEAKARGLGTWIEKAEEALGRIDT